MDARFPAWSDPGPVHKGLHWDVETAPRAWPVPFAVQGVVYLEETTAEQGALRVVPGFHRRPRAQCESRFRQRSESRRRSPCRAPSSRRPRRRRARRPSWRRSRAIAGGLGAFATKTLDSKLR